MAHLNRKMYIYHYMYKCSHHDHLIFYRYFYSNIRILEFSTLNLFGFLELTCDPPVVEYGVYTGDVAPNAALDISKLR